MTTLRRTSSVLAIVLLAGAGVSACSSDDEGKSSSSDGFFASSLEQLPDSARADDGGVMVYAADYDRATEIAGVERPPDGSTDDDEVADWLSALDGRSDDADEVVSALPPVSAGNSLLSDPAGYRDEVGWYITDVHSYVESQQLPDVFVVLTGSFDTDDLEASLGEADDGIWSIGGDDFSVEVADATPARPLGQSLRLRG